MYAYIEEIESGKIYVATIEHDTDYHPAGTMVDIPVEFAMRSVEKPIRIISLSWSDEPIKAIRLRESVGELTSFNGNRCVKITEDEYNAIIMACDAKRDKEKQEEIAYIRKKIAEAEAQSDIPSREEAKARKKAYNDKYNEGSEGYTPRVIDKTEYEYLLKQLSNLE